MKKQSMDLDLTSLRKRDPSKNGNGAAKTLLNKVFRYQSSEEVRALGIYPYFRSIQSCQNPEVTIDGRTFIMMGSNNYLGLVSEPRVIEAARQAALRYGTGCAGSRLLNGTLDIHEELERWLAAVDWFDWGDTPARGIRLP